MPKDFELLAAWRDGDADAGNTLIRRYYGPVLRFFEMRSRNADDLTQRTLLACVEGRERFRGDASFRTYLFAIARRVLMKQLADQHNAARLSRFNAPETGRRTSVSTLMARRQEQQILLAALATLEERDQTIIVLHYWEALTSREIAEVMDVPTSTMTTQLSRARRSLRERVEKLAAGSAGAALLGDLEGWTRSLAPAEALGVVGAAVGEHVLEILSAKHRSGS